MEEYDVIVEGLVKKYGEFTALHGISFRVRQGEIFGFLGPNGAGKTTTIKILTTLSRPTSGKAIVAGHDVVKEAVMVRKSIGVVFQEPTLDEYLTVYENLYVHGRIYGLKGVELDRRIREMLEFAELKEYRNKRVKSLSGGLKRRLEIARALLHNPRVLFLDEPTIGLDPNARMRVWEYISRLKREFGVTVFLTTHYMEEAEMLCDRIAIIDRGRIIAEGTPDELKALMGGDVIYVRIDDLNVDICPHLVELGLAECKALGNGNFMLKTSNATKVIPEILNALSTMGLRVREVEYHKPSLNDVFVRLTGKGLEEGLDAFSLLRRVERRAF